MMVVTGCLRPPPVRRDEGAVIVVAAGDISAPQLSAQQLTATLVEAQHPVAVLVLGDGQYPEGALVDYQTNYAPTWGRFKSITWPVPGNHEYKSGGAGYFAYFGERAGDPAKGYYSFDLGDWHLVALNTNHDCLDVACDADSAQLQWLEADLAASAKKCTLAYWHHPRWNSGSHGDFPQAAPIWKILQAHGVELVLNGHEHFYERFTAMDEAGAPSAGGVVQLTVGTGGVAFSEFVSVHPASLVRRNDTWGVVRLELGSSGWKSEFIGVPGSSFSDRSGGDCR